MGKRIVISEDEKKNILVKYITKGIIEEQKKGSIASNLYNKIKGKPIVKRLESLADPDFRQFVANVIREFPKYKNKESEILNQGLSILKDPETYLQQKSGEVDKIVNSQISEQAVGIAILQSVGLLFLMLIIYTAKFGKKIEKSSEEATSVLKQFEGKTLNLYNDPEEQYLFGTDKIKTMEFIDDSERGGRNKIKIYAPWFGLYEVHCLANPDRLAPYLLKVEKETIGAGTKYAKTFITKDPKYNKKFTDKLSEVVLKFCKAPEADFSVVSTPSSSNLA